MGRALVLMSGGVESTACTILLKEAGWELEGLFLRYSQPAANAERVFAIEACRKLGFTLWQETLPALWPPGKELYLENSDSYVPLRNTLFLVFGAAIATRRRMDAVVVGSAAQDQGIFFDNSFAHHKIMEGLISASLGSDLQVLFPTLQMRKAELIGLCDSHEIQTTSCWNSKFDSNGKVWVCGRCLQCKEVDQARKELSDATSQSG